MIIAVLFIDVNLTIAATITLHNYCFREKHKKFLLREGPAGGSAIRRLEVCALEIRLSLASAQGFLPAPHYRLGESVDDDGQKHNGQARDYSVPRLVLLQCAQYVVAQTAGRHHAGRAARRTA